MPTRRGSAAALESPVEVSSPGCLELASELGVQWTDHRVPLLISWLTSWPDGVDSTYSLNAASRWSHIAPIARIQASASANAWVRSSYLVSRPERIPAARPASSRAAKCLA